MIIIIIIAMISINSNAFSFNFVVQMFVCATLDLEVDVYHKNTTNIMHIS